MRPAAPFGQLVEGEKARMKPSAGRRSKAGRQERFDLPGGLRGNRNIMPQKDTSIVIKGERVVDDFAPLFRRRPLVCLVIIIVVVLSLGIAGIETFRNIPALKRKTADLQSQIVKIKQDHDTKIAEFGEVRRQADSTVTGLKRDLSDARRDAEARMQSLNTRMAETTAARDQVQSNLAPWVLLANSWYSNAPPDRRLGLLLERVNALTNTVSAAGRETNLPATRTLSPEAVARIRAKLDFMTLMSQERITVEILSLPGDPASLALGEQIKAIFAGYGFELKGGVQEAVREKPLNGLVLQSKRPLEGGPLAGAMLQLFKELDEQPAVLINPELSDTQLLIEVGSNR